MSHAWKAKFVGEDVTEAKRPKSLEDEKADPKRLPADAVRENSVLKDLLAKRDDARRGWGNHR